MSQHIGVVLAYTVRALLSNYRCVGWIPMNIQTAHEWNKGAIIFDTKHDRRHLPVRWQESLAKVEPQSTWRAYVAFGVNFELPNARDRILIFDAVSPEMSEVTAICITSDYKTLIPCHICEIDELLESGIIEVCSVDQQRLVLAVRQ